MAEENKTENTSLDELIRVLDNRRFAGDRRKELERTISDRKELGEWPEREEYRQYLIRERTSIAFSHNKRDERALYLTAIALIRRLATEHGIIDYPMDYDLFGRLEDAGRRKHERKVAVRLAAILEPEKQVKPVKKSKKEQVKG